MTCLEGRPPVASVRQAVRRCDKRVAVVSSTTYPRIASPAAVRPRPVGLDVEIAAFDIGALQPVGNASSQRPVDADQKVDNPLHRYAMSMWEIHRARAYEPRSRPSGPSHIELNPPGLHGQRGIRRRQARIGTALRRANRVRVQIWALPFRICRSVPGAILA
jgi:hypothetical protein